MAIVLSSIVGLAFAPTAALHAQCADGTPPPCDVRRQAETVEPPSSEARARSFLVMPFRNLTRSVEREWLVDGSVAMLTDALARWREASVVPPRRLYPALQRHGVTPGDVIGEDAIRQIAAETGAWTVVDGEFLAMGSVVRITVRSYDVVTGEEVARTERELRGEEDPRDTFDGLAVDLLTREESAFGALWDEATRATESVEAYRASLRGTVLVFELDFDGAREAYREAIALDSNYALAQVGLALSVAARAAVYREFTSLSQMLDPRSEANRAMQRAVALSATLPERERLLLQGMRSVFRVELPAARTAFGRVVAMDSTDVDALGSLAYVEIMDPVLVEIGGLTRPRGSVNEALRLMKRVAVLAPNRHYILAFLARAYREAAGHFDGFSIAGWDREPQSLLDFVTSAPAAYFVPVLMDSVELVPNEDSALTAIGLDTLRAARERALRAARGWAGEWLTAAPDDARPHDFLSTLEELAGNDAAALAALERAEALATEEPFAGLAARRAVLLGKLGRVDDATEVLDSLWGTNRLRSLDREGWFPRTEFLAHAWAVGLWLAGGRVERADSAWARLTSIGLLSAEDAAAALTGTLPEATSAWWTYSAAELPMAVLESATDSLLAHATRVEPGGALEEALPVWIQGMAARAEADGEQRGLLVRAVEGAEMLAGVGRNEAALRLIETVLELEPSLEEAQELRARLTRLPG